MIVVGERRTENFDYYDQLKEELIPYDLGFRKRRIGPNGDGGYVIYSEPLEKTKNVYSLGVGPVSICDWQLANMGKIINLYDSAPFTHQVHPNYRFKQIWVDSKVMDQELDPVTDNNLLLCMDIDGGEYETLVNMKEENLLKFSQISIEIHWMCYEYRTFTPEEGAYGRPRDGQEIIKFLQLLNKNFYLFHIHENNGALPCEGFPDVIECSYIRKDLCDKVEKETKAYPLPGIDFPNYNNNVEMPSLNWWL